MENEDCIFCKIIRGDVPCHKIYENEKTLVFLDINPSTLGHMLVIPKKHFENVFDVDEEYLVEVMKTAKKMSLLACNKLGVNSANITTAAGKDAQQSVFHLHVHVVPRSDDGLNIWHNDKKPKDVNFDELKNKLLN